MQKKLDLIIIGAGPIGLACAIEASKAGLNYLILEKGTLANSIYHYPTSMTFFSTSEKLELDGIPFTSLAPKPSRAEALEYYRRVAQTRELNIHLYEGVDDVNRLKSGFEVRTAKANYEAQFIVVATGFYDIPNAMNVPGEDMSKVTHYYKEPWPYVNQKVLVVGANNSAVDAALECWRKGAEVTMVIRSEEIGPRVKYWVRPDIVNRIKEGSIKAYFKSEVLNIRKSQVEIKTPDGKLMIENDFVLAMTGYRPNYELMNMLGIEHTNDDSQIPCYDQEVHETNVKGMYLAGVVCGGLNTREFFIENSRSHAEKIIDDICKKRAVLSAS